jgi:hypothetical protein
MKRKDALSSDPRTIDLVSDDRWRLHCRVERIGDDLLCRLGGGDEHVGAVALAQWEVGRARTECLIVGHHREKELALHAAHRLCKASRRSAVCIAGIHFDDLTANEVQAVSRAADRLTKQAAKLVEDEREHLAVSESSILARIESGAPELKEKIESFLRRPLDDLRSEHRAAIDSWAGEAIELFAPLYLSNACMNDCEYCGFRRSEHFPRTTLDREEALAQARYLAGQGHDSIELVTGEVPTPNSSSTSPASASRSSRSGRPRGSASTSAPSTKRSIGGYVRRGLSMRGSIRRATIKTSISGCTEGDRSGTWRSGLPLRIAWPGPDCRR